jgi:peroxiredoxin Q/BCP
MINQPAPNFTAQNQHGATISLSDFLGKKVVLYFYPKDDTSGCTAQACDFRDHYTTLQAQGYEVLGVSTDGVTSHLKFANKYALPFHLIADDDKNIVNAYGVWIEKSMYGRKYMGTNRVSFVIDEKGIITKIVAKVDTKNAVKQILN